MRKNLCIAIPTFNRSQRLDKAIDNLLIEINKSEYRGRITVLVSDNGSTDSTREVIAKYKNNASSLNIKYQVEGHEINKGFDANVLNCYLKNKADYIWFLSDDDNIYEGSIDAIFNDIDEHQPVILYYNFNQNPFDLTNPYIKAGKIYKDVTASDVDSISKIIHWPKLTSIVIRNNGKESFNDFGGVCGLGFMHVALVIENAVQYGLVVHSNKFIAFPDLNYNDCIDFPPYIGNNMDETVKITLEINNRMDLYGLIKFTTTDPLISSISVIATAYKKNIKLKPELNLELINKIKCELKGLKILSLRTLSLIIVTGRLLYWIMKCRLKKIGGKYQK